MAVSALNVIRDYIRIKLMCDDFGIAPIDMGEPSMEYKLICEQEGFMGAKQILYRLYKRVEVNKRGEG